MTKTHELCEYIKSWARDGILPADYAVPCDAVEAEHDQLSKLAGLVPGLVEALEAKLSYIDYCINCTLSALRDGTSRGNEGRLIGNLCSAQGEIVAAKQALADAKADMETLGYSDET